MNCRDGEPKCRLGVSCKHIQISGNNCLNVAMSQDLGSRVADEVPPLGLNQYDVMVIGDTPGVDCENRNMPFQGESGGMLLDYLEKAGFDPNKVYMTYTIRCKPPRGRRPTVQEVNTCKQYTIDEIKLIQPKVILLVGTQCLRLFNLHNAGGINTIRGNVYDLKLPDWPEGPTFKIVPTVNPATFLYKNRTSLKRRVADDYRLAYNLSQGDESGRLHYVPDWHLIDSFEKLDSFIEEVKSSKFFAFDTESAGLPYTKMPMLCFSFAWGYPGKCAVLPMLEHDPSISAEESLFSVMPSWGKRNQEAVVKRLKSVFEDPSITKAAHNIKYDKNAIRHHFGIRIKGFSFCTMAAHHTIDENPPHDLEYLADLNFQYGDYSKNKRDIVGHGKKLKVGYDKVPNDTLWPYAATDAEACYRLAKKYSHYMQNEKPHLWKLFIEEVEPLGRALSVAEWEGSSVNEDAANSLISEYTKNQEDLLVKMRAITWPEFKPLSNPDVVKAFQQLGHGLLIKEQNAASGYSANKKKLIELKDNVPLAEYILEYRNKRKMLSTYLNHALNNQDDDGRLRHSWRQHGTLTGRLSCTFFHQIPKIDESRVKAGLPVMKDILTAKSGYKYVYGDFSQVELRILALIAGDKELRKVFEQNLDLHAITSFEFLKSVWPTLNESQVNNFNRTEVGKRVNFGLAYGSQGHSLVKTGKWQDWDGKERNFTWKMLDKGMKAWKNRFPQVGEFIDNTPDIARASGGIATNVFGRERRFGAQLNSPDDYQRGEAERECVNFLIQSVAASLTNRTIINMHNIFEQFQEVGKLKEDDVFLVNTVHDSVIYECREELVPWVKETLYTIATRPIPELMNSRFKMDIGVGKTWTQAEMKEAA